MALLARSLAVVLVACSPTLPDGEIGCSDGRCPNGYTCGPDARCYIFSSLDADGIPDVFGIDASDAATDATSGPVLTPAWMMTFGGTGADEALGSTLVGSDLVVVGYLSPDAFFDGDPLSVPQNEQGFVAQLTLDGTVGEVSQWAATNVTRLADVASDGSRIFVAGSWNGELEDGTASSGFRSGWIGQLDEDFATISIWSGAGTQIATAIAHEDDQLIAGGFAPAS